MKKIYFLLIVLVSIREVRAQNAPASTSRPTAIPVALPAPYTTLVINAIRTWTPSMSTSDSATVVSSSRTIAEVKQQTQYFDGFGRLLQIVQKRVSPAGRDLVTPYTYDAFNREQYKYLPYVPKTGNTNDGLFKTNPFASQEACYRDSTMVPGVGADSIYYSQVAYEASPLNRVLQTWAPGNSWAKEGGNRPIKQQCLVNSTTDSVRAWGLSATGIIPTSTQTYAPGDLQEDILINEAGNRR